MTQHRWQLSLEEAVLALATSDLREAELETKLAEAEKRATFSKAVIDSLQDGVMAIDREGKVLLNNAAATRIMGYRPLDSRYEKFGTYYHFFQEDEVTPLAREKLPLARALGGEILHRVPLFVKLPEASSGVHISVSGGPILGADSEIIGAAVTIVDMTAFRETQAQLNEQHHMLAYASRMSAVGELAGAIAHEINTPLASASLLIESLKDKISVLSNDSVAILNDRADMLGGLVARIAKIVRSLRSVCRAGNNDPFTTAPISRILSDTEELCVEKLKTLRVNFSVNKNMDFETGVECRPVQIVQVLLNLVNNSCDAIKGTDQRWITLEVAQVEDFVEFRVTDSGPKIPDKIAKKLFAPLFSTKKDGHGSGIGLNISKKIIESHHGTIYLNREHKHTQFVIRVPLLQKVDHKLTA